MSWFVQIPDELRSKLRSLQEEQKKNPCPFADPKLQQEDAVWMYLGMGPAMYLTFDGRVLIDSYDWDGKPLREAQSLKEVASALALGARKCSMPELRDLLPRKPENAETCSMCQGSGYINPPNSSNQDFWFLCSCGGLGWESE